ncbi:hypothetical protein PV328_011636 [Microctonus aethiopoides]|uniref:Centrosome-associated FAM110 C-terminal domain-containing protein n=1 Tax=Microctonus aethiopoides TaxID=144406 RepID=A0AA39C5Q7_9HYME|nr:hypothetical protein PV328_011636 [Microctonus aethiopoides]
MMTAMARLPCKPTSITQQQQHHEQQQQQQQQLRPGNFDNEMRNYWDMQTRQQQSAPPTYIRSQHRQTVDHTGKRRSAVELLQESKAFYVKSEIVLDRKQELKNSGHLQVAPSTAPGAPPRLLRKCGNTVNCNVQQQQQQSLSQLPLSSTPGTCCWANCQQDRPDEILSPQRTLPPPLPPKSPRLISAPQRRAISGPSNSGTNGNDQLQTKLRRLLNTDSKENVFFSENPSVLKPSTINNGRDGDFRYSPGSPLAACRDDTDGRSTRHLNPDIKFKFGRSNSHSHSSGKNIRKSNISPPIETTICHKSLPDLHTSASRRRSSLSPRASSKSSTKGLAPGHHYSTINNCPDCETSSDYSAHSFKRDAICYHSTRIRRSLGSGGGDTSSVLSSGGRTQKSSGSSKLSHGATARDSGGSSGHCTHRSEPPPTKIPDSWNSSNSSHVIRRDSGASTQHSIEREQQHQQRTRKASYISGNSSSIVKNSSPNSDSSNSQTDYSPTCNSRFSGGWKEGHGRPILRSKSDISDRYWRHCNDNGRKKVTTPRPPRSVTELEIFFNQLGLDSENYEALTALPTSNSSSPIFFDSVSSVDSALGLQPWSANNQQQSNNCNNTQQPWQSSGANCSGGIGGNNDASQRVSDPPSIVERNARIIKWLCQCRKVQFGYS